MSQAIKFATTSPEFYTTLSQRVNNYFKSNNLARTADARMIVKTIVMFALYLVPYFISISGWVAGYPGYLVLCTMMGLGVAGIGLSVMHDANHGSYSSYPWINTLLGFSLNLVGGNAFNWKVQHNILHHTYTNVFDVDEDISPRGALRMAPESPWKPFHRYQYLYAWALYGLMTLVWVVGKDFIRLVRYQREGLVTRQKTTNAKEWMVLIVSKVFYFTLTLGIPAALLPFSILQIILGFLIMHFIAGFILAIVFQPAHVVEGTSYFQPDQDGNLQNSWAVHQMHTTTNFAMQNKWLSWYVGGLNFQVEHHLFPNICHIHYRALSPIVKATAEEFGIPYKTKETFWDALVAHRRILQSLGAAPSGTVMKVA